MEYAEIDVNIITQKWRIGEEIMGAHNSTQSDELDDDVEEKKKHSRQHFSSCS